MSSYPEDIRQEVAVRICESIRKVVRSSLLVPAAAAAIGVSASARAAVVFDDSFDAYANGNLVGQGNWQQTGTTATTPIQVAGAAADKYAAVGPTGQDVYKAFTDGVKHQDGDDLATSVEVNVTAAQATGDYFFHVSDPVATSTNFYQRLFARSSGAGYQLGLLASSGTGSATTWGTDVLNFGQAYDVDVDWNFVAGAQNDTFELFVDGASYLTHTWNSTSVQEPEQITAANLRQGSSTAAPTVQVDAIAIDGDTLVPEPGSFSLVAGGAMLAALLRRRRK
jgi:hypothetical protein